jgi:hypothetical protein
MILIREQAQTLFAIVEYAKANGTQVPTAKTLSKILSIDERAASARIKRLVESMSDSFSLEGRTKRIKTEALCTETVTAKTLLAIYEQCNSSKEHCISRNSVIRLIPIQDAKKKEALVKKLTKAGYIDETIETQIRVGKKLREQFDYLILLVK